MLRLAALALLAVPLAAALPVATPAVAQSSAGLDRVRNHLSSVATMVADFQQTDRKGQSVNGTLTLKRPGKIRFQYQKGYPVLIVGDGKSLWMLDYEVGQKSRWPIGSSPLGILLNPNKDLSRIATIVQDDDQVLVIRARDPKRPEFGTLTIAFTKLPSAPAGLMLRGWTTVDAQNGTTIVKLSNQRFNVAVADSAFRWRDPRPSGPRG